MSERKRKPTHPGIILDEHYIKPLDLNLQDLADNLGISRNTLFKIRSGKGSVTPSIAIRLASAFDTTPNLWLNLQQKYDLWVEENEKELKVIKPLYKNKPSKVHRKKRVGPSLPEGEGLGLRDWVRPERRGLSSI